MDLQNKACYIEIGCKCIQAYNQQPKVKLLQNYESVYRI